MSYQHIKFAIEDGIASLVLARSEVQNTFSDIAFIDENVDAVSRAQLNTDARVLALSAEGSAFSAAGNVEHMLVKTETFAGGSAAGHRADGENATAPIASREPARFPRQLRRAPGHLPHHQ